MININKLLKQVGVLLGSNLVSAGANFISVILLAKHLSLVDFGVYTLLLAYIIVFSALFNPQAWQGYIKFLSNTNNDVAVLTKNVASYDLICCAIGAILAFLVAPFYLDFLSLNSNYLTILQLGSAYIFFNQVSTAIGLLRYAEKFKILALQPIIGSGLFLLCVVFGYHHDKSALWFFMANLMTLLLGVFFIQIQAVKSYRDQKLKQSLVPSKEANYNGFWHFNFYTHLTNVVDLPVREFDTILVGSLTSVESSGIYKVIKQVGTITTKFTSPVTQVIYPELTKALADNALDKVVYIFKKLTRSLFMFSIPTALVFILAMEYWLPLIFKPQFLDYKYEFASYLIIHALAVCMLGVHPIFLAFGHVKKLLLITSLANIAFILVSILLASSQGLMGVIIAISIQYALTILVKWWIIKPQLYSMNGSEK